MKKHTIFPNNIYNNDGTDITVSTTVTDPGKVLSEKSQESVWAVTKSERGRNITIMGAMNALLTTNVRLSQTEKVTVFKNIGPPGASYNNSNSDWIHEELFVVWLKHFASYAKPTQGSPALLILDNDSSHISLSALNYCKEHIKMKMSTTWSID